MSTKTSFQAGVSPGNQPTPIADRLNSNTNWDGGQASLEKTVEDFVGPCPKLGGGRPHVLDYQMPPCIGETILTSLPVEPLYSYRRESEVTAAWRIGDTSQALIIYEAPERWDKPVYMLPFVGETQHDLLWMLVHTVNDGREFAIQYLTDDTIESILQVTRPEYRHGAEQLLRSHQC